MSKREELEAKGYKTYENDEIMIFWNPKVCGHAAECVRGNSDVFLPVRRPWIDPSQAPAREIADIIDRCPTKALQYELKETFKVVFEEEANRSAAYINGQQIGECEFYDEGSKWTITHTGVRPEFGGRGIARQLVEKVIEEANARDITIIPLCSYAKKVMES